MKTPNKVLSYFIESLEQEKQFEFDMGNWFQEIYHNQTFILNKPFEVENVCGTSACIAGTVAYRLNPESNLGCDETILKWIGVELTSYGAAQDASGRSVEDALHFIFTNSQLYGESYLEDITKDIALTLLNKLLEESHSTWESLQTSIINIIYAEL